MNTDWLNTDNINRSTEDVEYHSLIPFLPPNAKVLFLGSFPPQRRRWCMNFYYPNYINDHWRIEGEVFFGDRNHFVLTEAKTFDLEAIIAFCQDVGIAFFDTATAVHRLKDNASDEFLEVVIPTDIRALLKKLPHCETIVTTGQKATETLCTYFGIQSPTIPVGTSIPLPISQQEQRATASRPIVLYRLPSSSRAYPLSFDKKATLYRHMFQSAGFPIPHF